MNSHENPKDSHKYHEEYHDEIKFYQGKSNRREHLMTLERSTPEQRTPKNQSHRLRKGAADQWTMSHCTYIHIIL